MTLLNEADAVFVGDVAVDRVYAGSNLVWEKVTGPPPWTPAEITDGMLGWFDAAAAGTLTFSGANLTQWSDKSPIANHAVPFETGPVLTSVNGLGSLAFDTVHSLHTTTAFSLTDFTVCTVFVPIAPLGHERLVDHDFTNGFWSGRNGTLEEWGGGVMTMTDPYGIYVPLANGTPHQLSFKRNGATQAVSGNANTPATATVTTAATGSTVFGFGCGHNNAGNRLRGYLSEVLVWSKALSSGDLARTEGYLAWKWGIQAKLPAGHPYKDAAPIVEPPVVGPPVTAGLKVWIDASQLTGADGSPVSPWPNLVAGGAHGYVPGGAVPPKLKTNARNGLSVVHVNALEGRFVWLSPTTGVSVPYTVIYVACKTDLRVSVARVVGAVYPPDNLLMGYYSSFDQAYVGYFIGTPRTPVANEWNMYSMDSEGASRFWSNGVSLPGGGGGENNWGGSLVLGGYDPTAAYDSQCPDADYAELLMYDRKLSDAERLSVEAYLRTKWGLP